MLALPWCAPYILGYNDLVSQNNGFGPPSRLSKLILVSCNQQWISHHSVALNRPGDDHVSSGRVDGLFLLNRNIFSHIIL